METGVLKYWNFLPEQARPHRQRVLAQLQDI